MDLILTLGKLFIGIDGLAGLAAMGYGFYVFIGTMLYGNMGGLGKLLVIGSVLSFIASAYLIFAGAASMDVTIPGFDGSSDLDEPGRP